MKHGKTHHHRGAATLLSTRFVNALWFFQILFWKLPVIQGSKQPLCAADLRWRAARAQKQQKDRWTSAPQTDTRTVASKPRCHRKTKRPRAHTHTHSLSLIPAFFCFYLSLTHYSPSSYFLSLPLCTQAVNRPPLKVVANQRLRLILQSSTVRPHTRHTRRWTE